MSKIVVVTGSRAEYWLLRPLLSKLKAAGCLKLLVTGEHLQGPGLEKIRADGFIVDKEVECLLKEDSYLEMGKAISRGISHFSDVFSEIKPNIVVLLGDRYEIFSAAVAAYSLKIPIAHIHGGEVTHGALDDGFRHTISKMAGLHFVSHESYRQRLIKMGENPEKIHTVGAIGLDNLDVSQYENNETFFKKYPFLKNKDYFLLTLHASTRCDENIESQAKAVIQALDSFKNFHVLVTQSNIDPGGLYLNEQWNQWSHQKDNIHFVPILGDDYLVAAAYASVVIGNSSSGILEAPYLNRPVLNLGNRQDGRVMPKGVYTEKFDSEAIQLSLEKILNTYDGSEQVYGAPGQVVSKIYDILTGTFFSNLIYKKFYDA
ncbi:MAG: UDP-N-acetylglucosamine 2-epimerase (hydrolyzing) [Candidatus Pacebacteria bacterium]|nr:UDP-N-acetylglucosamine 2-epimerase (hydrolyzing) [Candidatus Paceibacterota bacterium]